MQLSTSILGTNIVERLQKRVTDAILTIGSDTFSRPQLSKIGCYNFAAAARLSYLVTHELKVKNTKDLFDNIAPAHLAIPGLGAITLATLGAAFEVKKLGTLSDYMVGHQQKGQVTVTFATMKHHAMDTKAAARERKDAKARKARRGNLAHELRVSRHLTRSNGHARPNGHAVTQ